MSIQNEAYISDISPDANAQLKVKKSLPGFLAKHVDLLYRWLSDYCLLFQRADDAQIPYFKDMSRDRRNQLIDDYVKIRFFIRTIDEMKNTATNEKEQCDDECIKDIQNDSNDV